MSPQKADGPFGFLKRLDRRTVVIVSAVVGVLVLAAVIYAVSALSSPAERDVELASQLPSDRSDSLLSEAIVKLGQGDEDAALDLLREAVALDPSNEHAVAELERLERSRAVSQASADDANGSSNPGSPSGDTDTGGQNGQPPADSSAWEQEYSLATLLPRSLGGYEMGAAVAVGTDAQVPADPTDVGSSTVRRVLFSVHDRGTTSDANSFITAVTKSAFPQNAADVTINGVPAYFGTDGELFASVAYARGRYVFEVIVTAEDVAPGTLVDAAVDAASAFPTTP